MIRQAQRYLNKMVLFSFVVLLFACETLPEDVLFRKIKIGSTKPEVLEILGSPAKKERKFGREWWYYRLEVGEALKNRMVVFDGGKVIYAGRVTLPKHEKSPELIDKEHDISNQGFELLPPKSE